MRYNYQPGKMINTCVLICMQFFIRKISLINICRQIPKVWTSLSGDSYSKEPACNAGNTGLIPGLARSPGEGYGNPLKYSYLESSLDRGAWQVTVHGVAKSQTGLSN